MLSFFSIGHKFSENVILYFIICLVFLALSCQNGGPEVVEITNEILKAPLPQSVEKRIIKHSASALDASNAHFIDSLVLDPHKLIISNSSIYILDRGDFNVKQFDMDGAFISSYGRGKGSGPGEFQAMKGLAITPNREVFVGDTKLRKIVKFASSGEILNEILLKGRSNPRDFAFSSDGSKVSMLTIGSTELFHILNIESENKDPKLASSFGEWLNSQEITGMSLTGEVVTNADLNEFYYVGYHDGWIYGATFEGEELFFRNAFGNQNVPPVIGDMGGYKLDPAHDVQNIQIVLGVWGENLYVARGPAVNWNPGETYIDVYNRVDGSYQHSIHYLQKREWDPCSLLFVTDQHIYASCREHIARITLE